VTSLITHEHTNLKMFCPGMFLKNEDKEEGSSYIQVNMVVMPADILNHSPDPRQHSQPLSECTPVVLQVPSP
jgi:hypothetical protein